MLDQQLIWLFTGLRNKEIHPQSNVVRWLKHKCKLTVNHSTLICCCKIVYQRKHHMLRIVRYIRFSEQSIKDREHNITSCHIWLDWSHVTIIPCLTVNFLKFEIVPYMARLVTCHCHTLLLLVSLNSLNILTPFWEELLLLWIF